MSRAYVHIEMSLYSVNMYHIQIRLDRTTQSQPMRWYPQTKPISTFKLDPDERMYLKEDNHAYFRQLSSVYRDPRPSFDGSCWSPRLTFSISSLTPCSPLTRYILLSSCSNSFNSDGRTVSRKLNSGKVESACSTEEENLAGWAVARVTHVVSLVLSCQRNVT